LLFERRIERKQSGRQVASSGSASSASIRKQYCDNGDDLDRMSPS
jgi:hypothetical protein